MKPPFQVCCIQNKMALKRNSAGILQYQPDEDACGDLRVGQIYQVIAHEDGWYRVIDDSGEDYLYPPDFFQPIAAMMKPENEHD